GAAPAMITDHVSAVRVHFGHAASRVAAAVPARADVEDRRDPDLAPPARGPAAAAAAPPEAELGGPGPARGPARRDTESLPPRAARAALDRDEAVALIAVEPLHLALRHLDLLRCGRGARHGGGSARATIALASLSRNAPGGVNRAADQACPATRTPPPGRAATAAEANTQVGASPARPHSPDSHHRSSATGVVTPPVRFPSHL